MATLYQGDIKISGNGKSQSLLSEFGVIADVEELNHLDGVVDNVQVQIDELTETLVGHNHDDVYDIKGSASVVQENLDIVNATLDAHIDNTDVHVTTENKDNWDSAYTHSNSIHARVDATKVENSTINGNILIDSAETNVYSHPDSGITVGAYKNVVVDEQGHVISGSNPTTLAEYGITDAETKTDANSKLEESKKYTDTVAEGKSDVGHNHDSAYDSKGSAADSLASANEYTNNKTKDLASITVVDNKITAHDVSTSAHNDIRVLISDLATRLNTVANSDDVTLDQLSEIVEYIKNNKSLIDGITTSKVNVADIVNNLTTNVTNKPLSAAQGVAIQTLIDELQAELDSHGHIISDVSGLQSSLDSKATQVGLDTHAADTVVHMTSAQKAQLSTAYNHSQVAHAPSNAEKNQNAFSNIKVGSTTVSADSATDTLTLVGENITITPDATNDKVTISVLDASTGNRGIVQLTNSTSSTSTTTAATPNSVKSAYDLANTANTTANSKASQTSFNAHTSNTTLHTNATERNNWNTAYNHSQSAHAPSNAEKNQNAFSNVVVGSTTISADNATDTLTLVAGSNVTLTPDASGDKVTIAATNTVYSHPNSGVSAGTYRSVTVNAQGHVTGGSNPTTLSGYGITDAATKSELNSLSNTVASKSNSGHTHDDRYYTESEVNNLLAGKAATSHGTHVSYSSTVPVMDGTASVGSASTVARSDHRHPTDTSRASASDLNALKNLVGTTSVSSQISNAIDDILIKAGFIYPLASSVVPDGFLLCDGAAYSRTEYPELFAAIGTTYGAGNGSTTFNVPNLTTRVPVGSGNDYVLGATGGEEKHTLTVDEMPSHKHDGITWGSYDKVSGNAGTDAHLMKLEWHAGNAASTGYDTTYAGGSQSHNNMQPYTVVNYIISTGKGAGVNVQNIIMGAQTLPLDIKYGGTGATDGMNGLKNLLHSGYIVLKEGVNYHYGDTLPNPGVAGRIFFKKVVQ